MPLCQSVKTSVQRYELMRDTGGAIGQGRRTGQDSSNNNGLVIGSPR
jgi:hypothetical protein